MYFSPRIVTSGLGLTLDAADTNSYPRTGTTWTDVSGNGNNGTLTNSPTFSAANLGSIVFNGVNQYVSIPSAASIKNSTNLSLEAWVLIASNVAYYAGIIGKGTTDDDEEYTLAVNPTNSKVYMDVGNVIGPYTNISYSFSLNTWYHIVGTHQRIAGSSTLNIYINGILLSGVTSNPTIAVNSNSTNVSIGSRFIDGTSAWNGRISTVRIYPRSLTATEVLQNYNATKTRFGI
jgi:hypothetical protein